MFHATNASTDRNVMQLVGLVEDQSAKKALDVLVPKLVSAEDTFEVRAYKGIGRIPKGLVGRTDPKKRILLDQLPRLLSGYGRTHANYTGYEAAVIVVCDLDDRCMKEFRDALLGLLRKVWPRPRTLFCLAIEEGEAWLLGDREAVLQAYPRTRREILDGYAYDSICGTWETLADAVYPGGAAALSKKGWRAVGEEKSRWAEDISPIVDVGCNNSPSFQYFRSAFRKLGRPAEDAV